MNGPEVREDPGAVPSGGPDAAGRGPTTPGVTAVVPLRDGVSGKSRLAAVLSDADRRTLVAVLARHVIRVLLGTPQVTRVVVVTGDVPFTRRVLDGVPGAAAVEILEQPPDRPGLNPALELARAHLSTSTAVSTGDLPAGDLLVVHADLPALTSSDVVALTDEPAEVVIATDRAGTGTNLLLLRGGEEFRFRFGEGSRGAHEREAERAGLGVVVVRRPGTAVDLDTTDDWAELPAHVRHAVGHGMLRRSAATA